MVVEIKDKVFFVTGAASGIGAETVKILVRENAKFVVVFDVNERAGVALEKELNSKYGNKVQFIKGDVTNEAHYVDRIHTIHKEKGLDVLINNAGIMNDSWATYKKEIEINVSALVTGSLQAMKLMRKDKGGKGGTIINIASVAGLTQSHLFPVYFATKAAVIQFSSCLGLDEYYSRTGVRVISVCFGRTLTALIDNLHNFDEKIDAEIQEGVLKYPGQSSEAAAKGVIEAFKKGASGSTWLANSERPAVDVTQNVKGAYDVMSRGVFE